MENTTLNTIRQHIIDNEQQPTNPYLDIKGNVTIGTGFKIDREDAFAALPLVNEDTGKPSTEAEKRQAWNIMQRESERAIKAKDLNKTAEFFEKFTNVRMPKAEQDKRLDREIAERVDKIKNDKDVGAEAWEKLTDGQKAVAVDIHYANGSLDDFPSYKKAMKTGDAEAMARESTFFTDSKKGLRDLGRLANNRAAVTGEDLGVAQKNLEQQFNKQKAKPSENSETIEGQTGEGHVKGGQGDDDLSPERKKLVEDLTKQDNPLEEILDKDPADLTEGELREIMVARRKAKTDADREKLFDIEKAFFEDKFGTGDAEFDFTGKMIDAPPIKPTNKTPVPAQGRDGKPVAETLKRLAQAVTQGTRGDGPVEVVKALQNGLNLLNRARTEKLAKKQGKASPLFSELKDDGDPGPKTRAAFKRATANLGPAKIKEGMALGRFKRLAEKPAFGDLRQQTEGAFGNLFRRPSATAKPRIIEEGFGLQATINDLGRDTLGNGFKAIKEDGDIGPKTEAAFGQVLPAAGNDNFTSKLGENLGFFDDDDELFG
jgi:GH24 family phage-related lysozyme (muramidase)